jgi:hypothetical protein
MFMILQGLPQVDQLELFRPLLFVGGGLMFTYGLLIVFQSTRTFRRLGRLLLALAGGQLFIIGALSRFGVESGHSPASDCGLNVRLIQEAKEAWRMDRGKVSAADPTIHDLFGDTNHVRILPICPSQGVYSIGALARPPSCTRHPLRIENGVARIPGNREVFLHLNLGWTSYDIHRQEWRGWDAL